MPACAVESVTGARLLPLGPAGASARDAGTGRRGRQRLNARPSTAIVGRRRVPRLVIVTLWVPAGRLCAKSITR